jgi:hypothetical protein
MTLVGMVRERACRLARRGSVGVSAGKHQGGRGRGGAGDAGVDQRWREPAEGLAVDAVGQAGPGRGTRPGLGRSAGGPLDAALQQGGVPEPRGRSAVGIPRSDWGETLRQEVPEGGSAIGRLALVLPRGGTAFGAAPRAVEPPPPAGAQVG